MSMVRYIGVGIFGLMMLSGDGLAYSRSKGNRLIQVVQLYTHTGSTPTIERPFSSVYVNSIKLFLENYFDPSNRKKVAPIFFESEQLKKVGYYSNYLRSELYEHMKVTARNGQLTKKLYRQMQKDIAYLGDEVKSIFEESIEGYRKSIRRREGGKTLREFYETESQKSIADIEEKLDVLIEDHEQFLSGPMNE